MTTRKLTGLVKYSNITLKWGITDDAQLFQWRQKAVEGKAERKNGSIVLLDDTGAEKYRWNFREGWPTKWTGPSFNATAHEVAIEMIEIAHEGDHQGMSYPTEFQFTLPRGYVDAEGTIHREGVMRLASAYDEIGPMKDPRVQANPGYLVIILLSRVVTKLGTLAQINPKVIEGLFAGDLAYLQELYRRLNEFGSDRLGVECPHCEKSFEVELGASGG